MIRENFYKVPFSLSGGQEKGLAMAWTWRQGLEVVNLEFPEPPSAVPLQFFADTGFEVVEDPGCYGQLIFTHFALKSAKKFNMELLYFSKKFELCREFKFPTLGSEFSEVLK